MLRWLNKVIYGSEILTKDVEPPPEQRGPGAGERLLAVSAVFLAVMLVTAVAAVMLDGASHGTVKFVTAAITYGSLPFLLFALRDPSWVLDPLRKAWRALRRS